MFLYTQHRGLLVRPKGILRVAAVFVLAALLLALPRLALAEAAGVQRVEGLDVDEVVVHGSFEVEIRQGEKPELLLRGRPGDLEPLPFHVRERTLVLGRPAGADSSRGRDVQFKLTLPTLARLQLLGSADVFVRPFTTPALTVIVDGSGDVRLYNLATDSARFDMRGSGDVQAARVDAGAMHLSLSGSGDIHLGTVVTERMQAVVNGSGDISSDNGSRSGSTEISIVGSGEVNFAGLDSDRAEINIVGSGTARIGEIGELDATIIGSGDIHYRGDPDIDQTLFGSGRLQRK
ncbi:GIN domain-containing protein [Haliea sp.]